MNSWMEEAYLEAKKAELNGDVPIGAVIVLQDKIVGRGHNVREILQQPVTHAELIALNDASKNIGSWRLENCDLYVTLEPCPMCLAASSQARIKRLFFGAHDPKGGALSLGYHIHTDDRLNHRFEAIYQQHTPSSELISSFFRSLRASKKK